MLNEKKNPCSVDENVVDEVLRQVMSATTGVILPHACGEGPRSERGKALTTAAIAALLSAIAGMGAAAGLSPEDLQHAATHMPKILVVGVGGDEDDEDEGETPDKTLN